MAASAAAACISFSHGAAWATQYSDSLYHKPTSITMRKHAFSQPAGVLCAKRVPFPLSKASESTPGLTSNGKLKENPNARIETFPLGYEELANQICDETSIAEIQLKIGDFEMYLKRDIQDPIFPSQPPIVSPTTGPPVPGEPMNTASPPKTVPTVTPTPPSEESALISNLSPAIKSKIVALEESGITTYKLVTSPAVGHFRRSRTQKGTALPPVCAEGTVVEEGQTIAFINQFENELIVKTDVSGEVLEFLVDDGDSVGYGDPVVAILPSFHELK